MKKHTEYIILFADKTRAVFCSTDKDLKRKTTALELLGLNYEIYRPKETAFENFLKNTIKLQEGE